MSPGPGGAPPGGAPPVRVGPRRVRPRLFAIDVDGTLLTSRHELTTSTIDAVRLACQAGIQVVVATSRPPRALLPILERLGLVGSPGGRGHPFIASHGALVGEYTGLGGLTVLDQRPMPVEAARAVLAQAPPGVAINWYTGDRWLVATVDELVRLEARIVGFDPELVDLMAQDVGPDKLLLLAAAEDPHALGGVVTPAGLTATPSTPTHLEVTRAGVDKGVALARLCSALEVPAGAVAAMGDGHNDLPMLAFAGTALAPANAVPEVLAVADLVTSSNDEDGLAQAVAELLG